MLPKIAFEEACYYPHDSSGFLPTDPQEISSKQGVSEEYLASRWPKLVDLGQPRIDDMLAGDVVYSLVSQNAPGLQGVADATTAVALARDMNDFVADQVGKHPDRLGAFASLPTQNPDAAAEELRRTVHAHGFAGAMINGYTDTADGVRYLDDPMYEPLWAAAEDLQVPVYLHPRPSVPNAMLAGHPELAGATWGFAPETATHVLRIVFSGVFDRYPGARLIIGHLGEGLPSYIRRIQHYFAVNPFGRSVERTLPEYFGTNIHVTTSGNFDDHALHAALLSVGADAILYSVDYPFADPRAGADWLDRAPISEADRAKIAHGNAQRMFRIPDSAFVR
ncbi:amidohydrolase family protein [Streptomyces coffeae]|uniref:Amidohydrolase n=1 Tax=Streptomyces coffeae TaxID=621382 RepID=A0ABS1NEU0_9ACTN|nr:amidohydrolase family protein [Streptomyces coffeae]MBL1098380.1 amidohydrolase [Streptomyces coffeae]